MRWRYLLFDLDGTLTDPMLGITRSVQYALRRFGIEVDDLRTLCRFIGPPLKESFRDFYGMSPSRYVELNHAGAARSEEETDSEATDEPKPSAD